MNSRSPFWSRPWFWAPAAALSSGAMFGIPAMFPQFYLLAWVSFVPFLLGLQQCRTAWQAYGFGLLTGFFAYAIATYWMTEFIQLFKAYSYLHSISLASLYWVYCAQIYAIVAILSHYGRRGGAMLWVFPTVLALVFAFYPTLFPWQLGNNQSEFLVAIQAVDITGVSGLDFILGIVNVLIAQTLIRQQLFFQRSAFAAYALVAVWFVYGVTSLAYWDKATANWDTLKVGLVQPDEPPTIGTPDPRPSFSLSYPIEMDLTEQLTAAGAELVIWPELRDKQFYTQPFVQTAIQRQVAELGRPLLLQSAEYRERGGRSLKFNTAALIGGSGEQIGAYRKIKRIALAEYMPLFNDSDKIERWMRRYMGEFFGDYSAGAAPKRFDLGKASIKPFICYEVLFPYFVAASTKATGGDILTVQSNNAWFGDTRVPYQHMATSTLRAVENRRPLVHVINNGLGGVLLPSGRILLRTANREIAGYLQDVPYRASDNNAANTTFYTRFPYWLFTLLGLGLALILVRAWRSTARTNPPA